MALILHLETATKVCSVALSENGKLLSCVESNDESFVHGEKLTVFIQEVLSKSGKNIAELAAVSISSGPGSYTGLRIGVSTAKGLCFALNIPLIAIDSLRSLILGAQQTHPNSTICAMIDARRMEVYSLIQQNDTVLKEISADVLDEASYLNYPQLVLVGDAVQKVTELFKDRDYTFETQCISSAKYQCLAAFRNFEKEDFVDVAYFEPFYLKDFIAGKPKG